MWIHPFQALNNKVGWRFVLGDFWISFVSLEKQHGSLVSFVKMSLDDIGISFDCVRN